MAGQGYFVCVKENRIILYSMPDGESIEGFAKKNTCQKCGNKIFYHGENI